jgi:hypothetical protein
MSDNLSQPERFDLIRIEGGNPSPEEIAAAKAVIEGMLREGGEVDKPVVGDDWSRARRAPSGYTGRHRASWSNPTT